MAKRINIRPTTSVYATYKNIRYDPWTAIAEFVDNSTQSYYDNSKKLNATKYWDGLTVDIEYKRDKVSGDHLIIKDNAYDYHGWLSKTFLNYYGIDTEKENKGIYADRSVPDVVDELYKSSNIAHVRVAKLLKEKYL